MKYRYVTALLTEDFLPGVLVLDQSLKNVESNYSLLVLITANISKSVIEILNEAKIQTRLIDIIRNPNKKFLHKSYIHVYSKLHIFNLIEYKKVVYLDADTFVCTNIDNLFDKPHMSGVNAGGMLPELAGWTKPNSGVLVLVPNKLLFMDFMEKIKFLSSVEGGDQGFLQSYYNNWPKQEELHLCHGYNMFVGYVNRYKQLFGYKLATKIYESDKKIIKILHYWADLKPWVFTNFGQLNGDERILCNIWFRAAQQVMEKLPPRHIGKLSRDFPNLNKITDILQESSDIRKLN